MPTERNLAGLRVLLVDDDAECREFFAMVLEGQGTLVSHAPNAETATQLLQSQPFDVVVTDKNLPGMDGIALIRYIRENHGNLPVILVTGQATVGSAVDAFKLGAQDYLMKPLEDGDVLARTVWSVLRQTQLEEENRLLQMKVMHSEKMEALGTLAGGVAHEINNPATFILTNMELLKGHLTTLAGIAERVNELGQQLAGSGDAEAQAVGKALTDLANDDSLKSIRTEAAEMVDEAVTGTERIRRITASLMAFDHPEDGAPAQLDMRQEVENALTLVSHELKRNGQVIRDLQEVPPASGIPSQIAQVLVNLLINAAHAVQGKDARVTVKTYSKDGRVCVEIGDNGKGIPAEYLEHIFDPFFTTKEVGKGTGLGLYVSYGIIKNHGGDIDVQSTIGAGTTVTITLPAIAPAG